MSSTPAWNFRNVLGLHCFARTWARRRGQCRLRRLSNTGGRSCRPSRCSGRQQSLQTPTAHDPGCLEVKSSQRSDREPCFFCTLPCTSHSLHICLMRSRLSSEAGGESAATANWRRFSGLVSKDSAGKVCNQALTSATDAMMVGHKAPRWGRNKTQACF